MRRVMLVGAMACTAVAPLPAQVSLRLGGLVARYADSVSGAAFFAAPRLERSQGAQRANLEASFAQFGAGSWAAQLSGELTESNPVGRRGQLARALTVGGNWLEGGVWSGQVLLGLALGWWIGPVQLNAGGAAGGVQRVSREADASFAFLGGATTRLLGAELRARGQRTSVGPRRYTDLGIGATRALGPLAADLAMTRRWFDDDGEDLAWQVQLVAELAPWVTMEGAGGAYPRSPDGFTSGRFATFGLRLARPLVRGGVVERLGPRRVRVTLDVRGATAVSIAGDWNQWTPVPMSPAGRHRWSVELPLGAGAHKFAIVLDGGRWSVPRGVPTLPDDFGGTVGLLVIS